MSTKKYWIRYVYADKACTETDYMSLDECKYTIEANLNSNPEIRFAYIMTYDSFGECFHELLRREHFENPSYKCQRHIDCQCKDVGHKSCDCMPF